MDQSQFDRIARLLGGATSRRRGLAAAIAALASVVPLSQADAAATGAGAGKSSGKNKNGTRSKDKDRDKGNAPGKPSRKPEPAGPCGSGKVADNRCRKNGDCCTNICKMKNKGKDGSGRCRCQRKNRPCTEDRNCCKAAGQQMTCIAGRCGYPAGDPVPTGQSCTPGVSVCADDAAVCGEYQLGTPAGTYCLLADGASCGANGECESNSCASGTCATNCTVCRSGCPYTKIADAVAGVGPGSTILIAPGFYDEGVSIDDGSKANLTLKRCGSRGEVRWTSYGDSYVVFVGPHTLTLRDLTLFGYAGAPTYNLLTAGGDSGTETWSTLYADNVYFESMAYGDSYGTLMFKYYCEATFTNCVFRYNSSREAGGGIATEGFDPAPAKRTRLTITDCSFYSNQAGDTLGTPDTYGGAVYLYNADATVTNSTFENNSALGGGAFALEAAAALTLTDCLVKGNISTDGVTLHPGGGIILYPDSNTAAPGVTVTLAGTTKIAGNTGSQGSGIAVQADAPSAPWSVTGAPGRVSGNVGAPDQCAVSTDDGTTWTGVAGCAF